MTLARSASIFYLTVTLILGSASGTQAAGKANAVGEFWDWITSNNEYISKQEFLDLVSDGQVVCYEPRENGSCSGTEMYPVIAQTYVTSEAHVWYDLGTNLSLRAKNYWQENYLCLQLFTEQNVRINTYSQFQNKLELDAPSFPLSSSANAQMINYLNQAVLGHCYAYKYAQIDGSSTTALIEYEFVEGVEQRESTLVTILPAGSTPVLYSD